MVIIYNTASSALSFKQGFWAWYIGLVIIYSTASRALIFKQGDWDGSDNSLVVIHSTGSRALIFKQGVWDWHDIWWVIIYSTGSSICIWMHFFFEGIIDVAILEYIVSLMVKMFYPNNLEVKSKKILIGNHSKSISNISQLYFIYFGNLSAL